MPDPTRFLSQPDPAKFSSPITPEQTPNLEVPIQVVTMARIGSGTGDGTMPIQATTPENRANVVVTVLTPVMVISIRAGKAFFTAFMGTMGAGTIGDAILPQSVQIVDIGTAFQLGLAIGSGAAFWAVIQSLAELFTKLDQKYPRIFGVN